MQRKRKKKGSVYPFRIAFVVLLVLAAYVLIRLPGYAKASEDIVKEMQEAADANYEAQLEGNRLKSLLAESDTSAFIERTARRLYDYCWYGEIIYEVENLDEIIQEPDVVVYQQEDSAGE